MNDWLKSMFSAIGEKFPFTVQLVGDWDQLWKAASVQYSVAGVVVMTLLIAVQEAWIRLPEAITSRIPGSSWISLFLFMAVLFGRYTLLLKKAKTDLVGDAADKTGDYPAGSEDAGH